MVDAPNSEQRMTYADFQQLCRTYCGDKANHVTSKAVDNCWSSTFFSKTIGYRFKCQCAGSREALRLEGCGVPPYYLAEGAASTATKSVVDVWPKSETATQVGKSFTEYDFFGQVCRKFCDADNADADYYVNKNKLKSYKWTFNSSRFSLLSSKKYAGRLFNCTCRQNKDERLSVSDGL